MGKLETGPLRRGRTWSLTGGPEKEERLQSEAGMEISGQSSREEMLIRRVAEGQNWLERLRQSWKLSGRGGAGSLTFDRKIPKRDGAGSRHSPVSLEFGDICLSPGSLKEQ